MLSTCCAVLAGQRAGPALARHETAGPRRMPGDASGPGRVRAENLVRGCDQQGCPHCRPAVMITGHVPAVRPPPDHADDLMAAAVPARGSMEDRRDPDPAPPARRPATAAATPPEPDLGGPGTP